MFRLYTEDINRAELLALLSGYFDSYTIIPVIGSWQNKRENSLIIELSSNTDRRKVYAVAEEIKEMNNQQKVLVTQFNETEILI